MKQIPVDERINAYKKCIELMLANPSWGKATPCNWNGHENGGLCHILAIVLFSEWMPLPKCWEDYLEEDVIKPFKTVQYIPAGDYSFWFNSREERLDALAKAIKKLEKSKPWWKRLFKHL